jgi:hypothetical protein
VQLRRPRHGPFTGSFSDSLKDQPASIKASFPTGRPSASSSALSREIALAERNRLAAPPQHAAAGVKHETAESIALLFHHNTYIRAI